MMAVSTLQREAELRLANERHVHDLETISSMPSEVHFPPVYVVWNGLEGHYRLFILKNLRTSVFKK